MERERIKLALEDRPVRSEFEALNDLHEGRLRTTKTELRRLVSELSNRLQVHLASSDCSTSPHLASEERGGGGQPEDISPARST
ncbi:unnamed protein product [Ectocarpus sp. 12 AP-2014]